MALTASMQRNVRKTLCAGGRNEDTRRHQELISYKPTIRGAALLFFTIGMFLLCQSCIGVEPDEEIKNLTIERQILREKIPDIDKYTKTFRIELGEYLFDDLSRLRVGIFFASSKAADWRKAVQGPDYWVKKDAVSLFDGTTVGIYDENHNLVSQTIQDATHSAVDIWEGGPPFVSFNTDTYSRRFFGRFIDLEIEIPNFRKVLGLGEGAEFVVGITQRPWL